MWKVIVADDEPFIREALKEMIPWDELGCHLAEALKKGKEVVNAVEKYKPDIVILDIQMPLMTGMEAAQWIHENYPDMMAGAVLAVLPLLILFALFQKQFIEGIALQGIKG